MPSKRLCKLIKIKFEVSREENYSPDFLAKIEESRQQYKKGEFVSIEKKDIKSFLGSELNAMRGSCQFK